MISGPLLALNFKSTSLNLQLDSIPESEDLLGKDRDFLYFTTLALHNKGKKHRDLL